MEDELNEATGKVEVDTAPDIVPEVLVVEVIPIVVSILGVP